MECTEGSDQESLPKPITRRDDQQQLRYRLEDVDTEMKQGIGKGGGGGGRGTDDDKRTENGGGHREDSTKGKHGMCSEEPEDLDETITNENISDYVMDQLKEKSLNVSCVGGDPKDGLHGLDVTEPSFESGIKDCEPFEVGSVNTTNSSLKLESVDLSSLIGLKEELISGDKEMDVYLLGNDNTETLRDDGNETEDHTIENSDFRTIEASSKVTGDGSDSGVEVNGCSSYGGRESSPALLRAFSSNSGGYTSSCGGLEDSLTASTATPAASCDSSLISCYSAYEDTEDIVTSTTTMMLQADGDGTSEGGSESSSVASKDVRSGNSKNGSSKRVTPSASRVSAKKRSPATDVAKSSSSSVFGKTKSTSPTATPVNSSRPKSISSHRQPLATNKTPSPSVGASAVVRSSAANTSSHKREKVPATMNAACSAIKSSSHRSSTPGSSAKSSHSMSKSVCGSIVCVTKGRSKDISLSSGSEGRRDAASVSTPVIVKGKGTRNTSSIRSKVIGGTDDGRWPSSANKTHSVTPRSRGGSVVDGQPRKLNVSGSSSVVSSVFMESKATALEKYATLPRRRRCKSPDVQTALETTVRSHSVSRDPSLNRAASLRKQHHQREGINLNKSLPPYPRRRHYGRTVIYHETSSQTVLTASDVEKALAGVALKEPGPLNSIETHDQKVQVGICFLITQ